MRRYTATLTSNNTATISLNENEDVQIVLTQGNLGSYVVTWATVNKWFTPSGTAPVLKTAVGSSDLITLWRTGGVVYGSHGGDSGPAGAAGATGQAGARWEGAYSGSSSYAINDMVYYQGSSYIAIQPSSAADAHVPNEATSAFWDPIVSAGSSVTTTTTDYDDNFGRADNANPNTGFTGWTYTVVDAGTISIASNQLKCDTTSGQNTDVTTSISLASADHHAQVTVGTYTQATTTSAVEFGAMVRCAAPSVHTGYVAYAGPGGGHWIIGLAKWVTGTPTSLGSVTLTGGVPTVGDTMRLTAEGTQLVVTYTRVNSTPVDMLTISDSSITTNTYCGLHLTRPNSTTNDVRLSDFKFGV